MTLDLKHMQEVKVKRHSVQKLEWKRTDGHIPLQSNDLRTEATALIHCIPPLLKQLVQEGLAVASKARDVVV